MMVSNTLKDATELIKAINNPNLLGFILLCLVLGFLAHAWTINSVNATFERVAKHQTEVLGKEIQDLGQTITDTLERRVVD